MLRDIVPPETTRSVLVEASVTGIAYAIGVCVLGFSRMVRARYVALAMGLWQTMKRAAPVAPPQRAPL